MLMAVMAEIKIKVKLHQDGVHGLLQQQITQMSLLLMHPCHPCEVRPHMYHLPRESSSRVASPVYNFGTNACEPEPLFNSCDELTCRLFVPGPAIRNEGPVPMPVDSDNH